MNDHPSENPTVKDEGYIIRLCDNVFELSAMAECLQIDRAITVEDSRALFYCVLNWAKEFEQSFDPKGGEDYLMSIETFARRKLLETFPFDPEIAGPEMLSSRQALLDYVRFTRDTSLTWPWAVSAEEILGDEQKQKEVRDALRFDPAEGYDTGALYEEMNKVFGVAPELESRTAMQTQW